MQRANLCQTFATGQIFNAEVCYGSGLQYNTDSSGSDVKREVEDFLLDINSPWRDLAIRMGASQVTTASAASAPSPAIRRAYAGPNPRQHLLTDAVL